MNICTASGTKLYADYENCTNVKVKVKPHPRTGQESPEGVEV